jgi:hypothetical protein
MSPPSDFAATLTTRQAREIDIIRQILLVSSWRNRGEIAAAIRSPVPVVPAARHFGGFFGTTI